MWLFEAIFKHSSFWPSERSCLESVAVFATPRRCSIKKLAHPGSFFSKKTIWGLGYKKTDDRLQNTEACLFAVNNAQPFALVFCFHANACALMFFTTRDSG